MSDLMVGQSESFMEGYRKGREEALQEASDLEMKIRKWVAEYPVEYDDAKLMLEALEKYGDEIKNLMDKENG